MLCCLEFLCNFGVRFRNCIKTPIRKSAVIYAGNFENTSGYLLIKKYCVSLCRNRRRDFAWKGWQPSQVHLIRALKSASQAGFYFFIVIQYWTYSSVLAWCPTKSLIPLWYRISISSYAFWFLSFFFVAFFLVTTAFRITSVNWIRHRWTQTKQMRALSSRLWIGISHEWKIVETYSRFFSPDALRSTLRKNHLWFVSGLWYLPGYYPSESPYL